MKFIFAFGLALFGFSTSAFAGQFDSAQNCVIVYVEEEAVDANLTMACDGTRYREDKVQVESALANPAGFKATLFEQFQIDVNASGTKQCQTYDLDGVWWAACQTF